jgi:hypothetical protein
VLTTTPSAAVARFRNSNHSLIASLPVARAIALSLLDLLVHLKYTVIKFLIYKHLIVN